MVSVQSRIRSNMAASPAIPGFGNSGKSFLIDNLLQPRTPSVPPAGGHLRLGACDQPRRTWSSEHGSFQSQALSPTQVKALGGPLLPHSGGKYTSLKIFIYIYLSSIWTIFAIILPFRVTLKGLRTTNSVIGLKIEIIVLFV